MDEKKLTKLINSFQYGEMTDTEDVKVLRDFYMDMIVYLEVTGWSNILRCRLIRDVNTLTSWLNERKRNDLCRGPFRRS